MLISKDTNEILDFLDYATNNGLRKRNDIAVIIELSASYNEMVALENLLFHGTSLWNIQQTLKRNIQDSENIVKLNSEAINVANEIKHFLQIIIGEEHLEISRRFNTTYLINTKGSFSNIVDLSHDIAHLKNVIANMKNLRNQEKTDSSSTSSK